MSTEPELTAFAGGVQCQRLPGTVNLRLRGRARAGDTALSGITEVLFCAAEAPALPERMHDAHVLECAPPDGSLRRYRIEAAGIDVEFPAHGVQIHRDAAREFYGALPPPRVPWRLRLGWAALLAIVRIPGAEALVRKLRGAS